MRGELAQVNEELKAPTVASSRSTPSWSNGPTVPRRASEVKSSPFRNQPRSCASPLNSINAPLRMLADQVDGGLNEEQQQRQVSYIRQSPRP
ncbi:MAG: hypothetical protein U1E60_09005 [Reyranellaceae bacterium]